MRLSDSDDAWSGDDDVQSTSQTSNSCVAVEDELREADCREDAVRCFAMGADGAVWATMHGSIYVWHQRGMPDPVLVGDLPDASRLTKMVMTTERQLFIVSTVRVALFNIVDGSDPGSMELEEVFSFPCPEASTATHVSASPDGALVALSSPSQLLVVPCDGHHRRRLVDQAPFQQEEDDVFMDSPMYLSVNCNQWYSESGCVCTCFASSERLFVLSASNHLVSVRPEWESQTVVMLRDGHVLTRAHHVVCMSASSIRDAVVVVGLSDGTIKVLQMDTLEVIRTVDVIPLLERQIYPPNQPEGRRGPGDVNGHAWRAAKVMPSKQHGANKHGSPVMSGAVDAVGSGGLGFQPYVLDVSAGHHHVMVAMPDAVLYFDKHSFKLDEERTCFMDSEVGVGRPPKPHGDGESSSSAMCVACGVNGSWVSWHPYTCLLLYYVAAAHQGAEHRDASAAEAADRDVVHAHTALPAKWLEPFLIPSEQQALEEAQRKQKKVHGRRGTADKDKDKPVTFGHPVKSSGYGDVPWSVQQDRKRAAAEKKKAQEAGAANIAKEMRYRAPSGPYTQHPFTSMTSANRYVGGGSNGVHRSAILCSTFTADGRGLLTASGDATGNLLKYPVAKSKGEGVALRGHKAPVLSIDCGLSIKTTLVVTSSSDSSISVWKPEQKEAPFITHQVKGAKDVKVAKFFYQDKFISYVAGSNFHLSRFALDKGAGELNRIRNESCLSSPRFSYRSDAQQITAMASINHFQSNLVVLGGSNKHICVLDVAVEQPLRIIPDAHARAIHSIAMCTHSRYADHVCSLNAQQHFVSAGLDGVVNLWDLRESRCVRQFALHKNNALSTLGLAMSPTGSIIAVGSEDRQVYLYDILCPGTPLDVLKCEDCPTSLAWHGTEPVLAACLASGGITFFGQR